MPDKKSKSRAEEYAGVKNRSPKMPEIEHGEHILGYLQELGTLKGGEPLPFFEIESWSRMTGVNLTSWGASMIRRLSQVYCAQASISKKPTCPPPWRPAIAEPEEITDALDKAFDRFNKQSGRKR